MVLQDAFVGLPGVLQPAEAALERAAQAQVGDVAGLQRQGALDVAHGFRQPRQIVERRRAIVEGLGLAGVHHDGAAEGGQPSSALPASHSTAPSSRTVSAAFGASWSALR